MPDPVNLPIRLAYFPIHLRCAAFLNALRRCFVSHGYAFKWFNFIIVCWISAGRRYFSDFIRKSEAIMQAIEHQFPPCSDISHVIEALLECQRRFHTIPWASFRFLSEGMKWRFAFKQTGTILRCHRIVIDIQLQRHGKLILKPSLVTWAIPTFWMDFLPSCSTWR